MLDPHCEPPPCIQWPTLHPLALTSTHLNADVHFPLPDHRIDTVIELPQLVVEVYGCGRILRGKTVRGFKIDLAK